MFASSVNKDHDIFLYKIKNPSD